MPHIEYLLYTQFAVEHDFINKVTGELLILENVRVAESECRIFWSLKGGETELIRNSDGTLCGKYADLQVCFWIWEVPDYPPFPLPNTFG